MRRPQGGLWSHPDFVKLWTGQSISEVGSQVSQLALPWLAAVGLHASPFQFSLLGVLGFMPFILFALPAGVWVDRLRRRYILIAGDAARAVLLIIIPILWATHELRIWHLLVLQFVIGVFTVFFDVAYQSYLPALVEREHLIDGNSKIQLTASIAQVGGPNLSGVLIAAITAPYAIVVDAVSFIVSSVFMISMRHREEPPKYDVSNPRPKMWPQVKEGLDWVVKHPWLRAIAACTATSNFFSSTLFAIMLLYMVRFLHLSAYEVAAVFAVGSAGSIVASLVTGRLNKWQPIVLSGRKRTELIVCKALYLGLVVLPPFLFLPVLWAATALVLFHFVFSWVLSVVFQVAHLTPGMDFEGVRAGDDWAMHQVRTTADFATRSRLASWFTGGLNHQVEHHLFPNVAHTHYPALRPIVRAAAMREGLPSHDLGGVVSAVRQHFVLLKALGSPA